ncbi:MAG: hypothetical protein ACI8XO_003112 [Verrucomicrobiales bacterium]|jgi:hypothetical protein
MRGDDFFQDDPEFFEEVDVFLAAQPEDLARVEAIAGRLPVSFDQVLRERESRVVELSADPRWNWSIIAASASVAASLVAVGLLFLLNEADVVEPGKVAKEIPAAGEMEFVVTFLPDGESEVEAQPMPDAVASEVVRRGERDVADQAVELVVIDAPVQAVGDWYLRSPDSVDPPKVSDERWPRSDIDRFVLAALDEHRIAPVADADGQTLLRRISFDLTGLPPSPELVEHFLRNQSPAAYGSAVDELLATWQFGELWAQHWLEAAGYDPAVEGAWRFREYVVASLNDDKRFDRFLKEQLAGDMMGDIRQHLATGFYAADPQRDAVTSIADVILGADGSFATKREGSAAYLLADGSFSSLSEAFARADQSKMLPLNLDRKEYPVANLVEDERVAEESKRLRGMIASGERRLGRAMQRKDFDRALRLRAEVSKLSNELVMLELAKRNQIVSEGAEFVGLARGAADRRRLAEAHRLADGSHPLTSRVFVNRVWGELFGHGLVADTGAPSHRELLDYLAVKFVGDGWSVKSLVKQMVMSRTYQLSEMAVAENLDADKNNRWLWRHTPRALGDAEVRDAVHAVAGWLDPVAPDTERMLARYEYKAVAGLEDERAFRSLYLDWVLLDEEAIFEAAIAAAGNMRSSRGDIEARVREVFVNVLARTPSLGESAWAVEVISRAGSLESGGVLGSAIRPDKMAADAAVLEPLLPRVRVGGLRDDRRVVSWAMLFHALLMSEEFRTVR